MSTTAGRCNAWLLLLVVLGAGLSSSLSARPVARPTAGYGSGGSAARCARGLECHDRAESLRDHELSGTRSDHRACRYPVGFSDAWAVVGRGGCGIGIAGAS